MKNLGDIKLYLKYPLMWVMLLWALTLPGHEVAVYSFIMKGTVAKAASVLKKVKYHTAPDAVEQQALQVFLDARAAPPVVLTPQHADRYVLPSFLFNPPANEELPACADNPAGTRLLAHTTPVAVLPNAP
ncbi:hypothetical protein [Pontibacter ruber]|uniref:Uncharacterized protein n=1 Tax=Pontibacter ruber TaxID=1343895 RepID=A0ABW5CXN2_9BACT|nr:hypothetical protein [Pontibacter ruber]